MIVIANRTVLTENVADLVSTPPATNASRQLCLAITPAPTTPTHLHG